MQVGLTTVNGAMHDNTSIWRMPPSPEVDAAWDSLTRGGLEIITVSAADIKLSGKDPALSVKAPPSWDQGPDAYFAQIDIFHILHCLDGLRKEMWSDYYYDDPVDPIRRELKAHCLHTVLQNLLWTGFSVLSYQELRKSWAAWPGLIVAWIILAMSLELLDFPPLGGMIDAHSLWHLGTVGPTVWWYR